MQYLAGPSTVGSVLCPLFMRLQGSRKSHRSQHQDTAPDQIHPVHRLASRQGVRDKMITAMKRH
jgi:hypothetical protein